MGESFNSRIPGKIIFKAIVGSQSYGTSIPTSDIDIKGVYMQNEDDLIGFWYKEQVDVWKDECYYEVRRFLQLLESANPTVLELLYSPENCIQVTSPEFELIKADRQKFLTKLSFLFLICWILPNIIIGIQMGILGALLFKYYWLILTGKFETDCYFINYKQYRKKRHGHNKH